MGEEKWEFLLMLAGLCWLMPVEIAGSCERMLVMLVWQGGVASSAVVSQEVSGSLAVDETVYDEAGIYVKKKVKGCPFTASLSRTRQTG